MLIGPVITNIQSLPSLQARMIKWNAIKIVPAWGFAWDPYSRAQVRAMTQKLIIRTKQGDPSSGAPYLHFEKTMEEILEWITLFPDSIVELGNEPNSALKKLGIAAKQEFIWGYAYHLRASITAIRQHTRSWVVKPKILAPAMSLDPSMVEDAELFIRHEAIRPIFDLCNGIAQHVYVTQPELGLDFQIRKALDHKQLYKKPHYLTEVNANPFNPAWIKPSWTFTQWESLMYYHINDGDTLDANYHIDVERAKALQG